MDTSQSLLPFPKGNPTQLFAWILSEIDSFEKHFPDVFRSSKYF